MTEALHPEVRAYFARLGRTGGRRGGTAAGACKRRGNKRYYRRIAAAGRKARRENLDRIAEEAEIFTGES